MKLKLKLVLGISATLLALGVAQPVHAQSGDSKILKVVVPLSAGGGVDTVARKLAEKLGTALGRPVIVENKPGASGTIGIDAVAKAAPDGNTLVLTAGSAIAINPHVIKKMPYDTAKDLVPVAQVGTTPLVLLVNASSPIKNVKELIALVKAKPKSTSFGSYGNASVGHLLGEALNKAAGIDMVHVPYKGAAPAITDLIGGQVTTVIADFGSSRVHIAAGGKLRAIAVTGPKRLEAFPNVPTFTESGLPTLEPMGGWLGVFAPAKTPKPVVDKLAADIGKTLQSPELKGLLAEIGYEATGIPTDKFAAIVKQDTERWGAVIKSVGGITLE